MIITSCMTRPSDGRRGGGEKDPTCCHPLSSVIRLCTLTSPVVSRCRSSTPVTTRCHPLPFVDTRYYPLSPFVTRCDPSPTVATAATRGHQFCPMSALKWFLRANILYHLKEHNLSVLTRAYFCLLGVWEKLYIFFSDYLQIWPILKVFWPATDGK